MQVAGNDEDATTMAVEGAPSDAASLPRNMHWDRHLILVKETPGPWSLGSSARTLRQKT